MKYFLKEKLHPLYTIGQIYDEDGEEVYDFIDHKAYLKHPEIDLYRNSEYIGTVKENFRTYLRRYDIYYKGALIDTLNQKLTRFGSRLVMARVGWIIEGDLLARNYRIYNENRELLASVKQELFHLAKHLTVRIYGSDSEVLLILLCLAISQFDKEGTAPVRRRRSRMRRH